MVVVGARWCPHCNVEIPKLVIPKLVSGLDSTVSSEGQFDDTEAAVASNGG